MNEKRYPVNTLSHGERVKKPPLAAGDTCTGDATGSCQAMEPFAFLEARPR